VKTATGCDVEENTLELGVVLGFLDVLCTLDVDVVSRAETSLVLIGLNELMGCDTLFASTVIVADGKRTDE
jgi:hypothetical protein